MHVNYTTQEEFEIGVSSLTVASPPLFTSSIWQKYNWDLFFLCTLYQDPLLVILVVSSTSSKPHWNYVCTPL